MPLSFRLPPHLHDHTPARPNLHPTRPTMHILPDLNTTLHLRHHPNLIQTIVPLPPTTARTVAQWRLGFLWPFLDRAFFGK